MFKWICNNQTYTMQVLLYIFDHILSCLSLTVLFSQISYYYCQFFLTSYEEDICNVIVIHNINYLSKIYT